MFCNLIPDYAKITRRRWWYSKAFKVDGTYRILTLETKYSLLMDKSQKVLGKVLTVDLEIVRAYQIRV